MTVTFKPTVKARRRGRPRKDDPKAVYFLSYDPEYPSGLAGLVNRFITIKYGVTVLLESLIGRIVVAQQGNSKSIWS